MCVIQYVVGFLRHAVVYRCCGWGLTAVAANQQHVSIENGRRFEFRSFVGPLVAALVLSLSVE